MTRGRIESFVASIKNDVKEGYAVRIPVFVLGPMTNVVVLLQALKDLGLLKYVELYAQCFTLNTRDNVVGKQFNSALDEVASAKLYSLTRDIVKAGGVVKAFPTQLFKPTGNTLVRDVAEKLVPLWKQIPTWGTSLQVQLQCWWNKLKGR